MKKSIGLIVVSFLILVAALVWERYQKENFSEEALAQQVEANLVRQSELLVEESKTILRQSVWNNLDHPFYLIDSGSIVKWNSTEYPISVQELTEDFTWRLLRVSHSELLAYKFRIDSSRFAVGLIPLHHGFELSNRFLVPQWNRKIFSVEGAKILDVFEQGTEVKFNNAALFKIQIPSDPFLTNTVSFFLAVVALIMFLVWLFIFIRWLHRKEKHLLGFVTLAVVLSALRIAMVQFAFPSRWLYSPLFDSKYFASSSFNASAGDFLLNALIVFICCYYLFGNYYKMKAITQINRLSTLAKTGTGICLMLGSYFSFLFPQLFVESIFHDSVISFDISEDLNFDALRIAVLLALLFGVLSSFFVAHVFIRVTKLFIREGQFLIITGLAAIIFFMYFYLSELNYWPTFFVGSGYFLFIYYSPYFKSIATIGYRTFPIIVIVIVLYSTQASLGIWRFKDEKKVKLMFRSATNLFTNDVLGEYLLYQAAEKIKSDNFISSSIVNPLLSKNEVRQKIRQIYLSDYFNRYELKTNLYRADGTPADSETALDFATAIKTVQDDAFKTSYEGIYLIQNENADVLKRYLAIVPVVQHATTAGYVVIDLSVKHIAQQRVYPSLLVDSRFVQSLGERNFSYATYNRDKLVDHFGLFNFEKDFDPHLFENPQLYKGGIDRNGFTFIGIENENNSRIVLASNTYPVLSVLANFSFLFSLGIAIILVLLFFLFGVNLFKKIPLNYSARIQILTSSSFIIPLIAVSLIALRMINLSNESKYENDIQSKGSRGAEALTTILVEPPTNSDVKNKLTELSQTLDVEMNLYTSTGELMASSQQAIFRNQLTMSMVNNVAWQKIAFQKYIYTSEPSSIGSLKYSSSYFAIKSKSSNQLLGILEIPFFEHSSDSASIIVFSNIITTFTIVFIVFSFVSLVTLERLTSPLRFIAKKLNATFISTNKPIEWTAKDEIGQLVKEYNRMLGTLEQSKTELAKREKENAWREIAQQVAHEIKNPLTPMKLTLQQLELLMAKGELSEEKSKQSVNILLSQLETLNQIATTFNSFATMPAPEISQINLTDVLRNTILLYENNELGEVYFEVTDSEKVFGDAKLLGRIFSNIILNGLQSGEGSTKVKVGVSIMREESFVKVKFSDDGKGIAAELVDKIFLPHFTTKKTGSGLGLAIAKQGIEQMGGAIWFETGDAGTNFYVRLKSAD